MRTTRLSTLAVAAVLVLACQDTQQPVDFAVSDGSDFGGGGNPHFFFLPPLVPSPEFFGTFDGTLLPYLSIRITGPFMDDLSATCEGPVVRTVTSANGLAVDLDAERYSYGWKTSDDALTDGKVYRICVRFTAPAGGAAFDLGFRDAQPTQGGGSVAEDPIYLFNNGSNVEIKFRVEEGVLSGEFCDIGEGGVEDCTAALLGAGGGTATCENETCGLSVPTEAIPPDQEARIFVVERILCGRDTQGPQGADGKYAVNQLAVDIPQFGGCLQVTVLDPNWTGFSGVNPDDLSTYPTLGACFVNEGPYAITDPEQQSSLQLHVGNAGGTQVVALPQAAAPFLGECDPDLIVRLPDDATPLQRLAHYARRGLREAQRVLNPWFAPPAAMAFHTGFGGHTGLNPGDGGGEGDFSSAAALAPGLSLSSHDVGSATVFHAAWALPSQMEKVDWVDPVVGNVGDVKSATVLVTDNGLTDNLIGDTYEIEPPRPVHGATVWFDGTPVKTGPDGRASYPWTLTPAGSLTLIASGFGIGFRPPEGTPPDPANGVGPWADHFTSEIVLGTGELEFHAYACSAADTPTLDGAIGLTEYKSSQAFTAKVSGGSTAARFYWTNDCESLYLAVEVNASSEIRNALRFVFDNDGDGETEVNDDVWLLDGGILNDRYLSADCLKSRQSDCGPLDADGLNNLSGVFTSVVGKTVYEMKRALTLTGPGNPYDVNVTFGSTFGVYLVLQLGKGAQGNTEWPGFRSYKQITVVTPGQ
jgi:hypothetical protein